MGCSLQASAAPSSDQNSRAARGGSITAAPTRIAPSVSVPVLSNTTTRARRAASSTCARPHMHARGASGQAMRTAAVPAPRRP